MSVDLSKIKPGDWVITTHWRGPVAQVAKITPKRVRFTKGSTAAPEDIQAVFATEADAQAGWERYQAARASERAKLAPLIEAATTARRALDAARHQLTADAWAAARGETDA